MRIILYTSCIVFVAVLIEQACAHEGGAEIAELDRIEQLLATGKTHIAATSLDNIMKSLDSPADSVRALFDYATVMRHLGRTSDEIAYLEQARLITHEAAYSDDALYMLAQCFHDEDRIEECNAAAGEFRRLYPDSPFMPEILYIAGHAAMALGEYPRAFNAYNEITKNHQNSPLASETTALEGICLYHLGLTSGALDRLEQYLSKHPDGANAVDALFHAGRAYEKLNQPSAAATMYKRLMFEHPDNTPIRDILYRLGVVLFNSGNYIEAANAFLNHVANTGRDKSTHDESLLYLERIKYHTGEYHNPTDIAEHFIAKYPDSPKAPEQIFSLGEYYAAAGNYQDAIEKYSIIMNNDRYKAHAYSASLLIARLHIRRGQPDDAVSFLKSAANNAASPATKQKLYLNLGIIYEELGMIRDALRWYGEALDIGSDRMVSFRALVAIAHQYRALQSWHEAITSYERITKEFRSYIDKPDLYMELADIYLILGKPGKAVDAAETAVLLTEEPMRNDILLYIAEITEEINEDHAENIYSIVVNDPSSTRKQVAKALVQSGELAMREGDREHALSAFSTIISNDYDSLYVALARSHITRLRQTAEDETVE